MSKYILTKRNIATQQSPLSLPFPAFSRMMGIASCICCNGPASETTCSAVSPVPRTKSSTWTCMGRPQSSCMHKHSSMTPRLHARSISKGFDIFTTSKFSQICQPHHELYQNISKSKVLNPEVPKTVQKICKNIEKKLQLSTSARFIKQ